MRRAARWETHKNKSSTVSSVSPVSRVVRWIDLAHGLQRGQQLYRGRGIGVGNGSPHQQVIVAFLVMKLDAAALRRWGDLGGLSADQVLGRLGTSVAAVTAARGFALTATSF